MFLRLDADMTATDTDSGITVRIFNSIRKWTRDVRLTMDLFPKALTPICSFAIISFSAITSIGSDVCPTNFSSNSQSESFIFGYFDSAVFWIF